MKIKVVVVMLCCFLLSVPRADSQAATFPSGKSFSRIQTCTDRVDIYENAKPAVEGIGYSVANDCPNGIELIALSAISSFGNLLLWASHGGEEGYVVVEQCYATQLDAMFRKNALEATAYRPGDLAVYFVDAVNKWGVALTTQGIRNTFSGDIAFVASCYGGSTANNWATHEVGYAGVTSGGTTRTDMTAVFQRLTAAQNHNAMTVASALNGEQILMRGSGDIALMPWVVSYVPTATDIYTQYFTVSVTFGGPMQSVNFLVGGYGVKKQQGGSGNSWWVQVQTGWALGDVIIGVVADQAKSSNGIALKEDWHVTYYSMMDSYPPAASVASFVPYQDAGGNRIFVDLAMMRSTLGFVVLRDDGRVVEDTVWVDKMQGHTFELFDAEGRIEGHYRLLEIEKGGKVFIRADEGVFPQKPEVVACPAPRFKSEQLRGQIREKVKPSLSITQGNYLGIIIVPDEWTQTAQIYADFWTGLGKPVCVVPTSVTGTTAAAIDAYLAQAYAQGVRYVVLAGDASDHLWFDDPARWPNDPGEDDWYYWYQDYHTPGGYYYLLSQPQNDKIPTFYFPDTLYNNMSYWTPYYSSDWPYSDVDNDGYPDLRVGRFPVHNEEGLLVMISKTIYYIEHLQSFTWANQVSLWGYCHDSDGNFGDVVESLLNVIAEEVPPEGGPHKLYDRNWPYTTRVANAIADWSDGRGVVLAQGTSSTPTSPIHFFKKSLGFTIDDLPANHRLSLYIGASCGICAYDMAEDPNLGTPVVEDLLDSDPDRGAIAAIGATRGTWIQGDHEMSDRLFNYLLVERAMDIGSAFMLAQREVMAGAQRQLAESWVLLGDPFIPVPGSSHVADTGDVVPNYRNTLGQNYPNPFNPLTTVEYSLKTRGPVSLKVYDVTGRLVRTLAEEIQEAGSHKVTWDGKDSSGRKVASGVYFCRFKAGESSSVNKMVLLK